MEKFIKTNRILIIGVVFLAFLFYWYEWRPTEIKKRCNEIAIQNATKGASLHRDQNYKIEYEVCLRSNGV